MEAYSQDLRDRIIDALKTETASREEVAQTFGVSRSFVQKLWRRWRETGSSAALAHAGGRRRALANDARRIRREITRQPDVTLAELCERVERAGGASASPSMMCRELRRLRLPRKKSRSTPVSGRPPA